jgi:hypothetical protein
MKAILINPFNRTVTAVDADPRKIAEAIGARLLDAIPAPLHVIYVDDEGLYVQAQSFWRIRGVTQSHIAGKAIMFGSRRGEETDCVADVRNIASIIEWCDPPTAEQLDKLQTITVTPF